MDGSTAIRRESARSARPETPLLRRPLRGCSARLRRRCERRCCETWRSWGSECERERGGPFIRTRSVPDAGDERESMEGGRHGESHGSSGAAFQGREFDKNAVRSEPRGHILAVRADPGHVSAIRIGVRSGSHHKSQCKCDSRGLRSHRPSTWFRVHIVPTAFSIRLARARCNMTA